MPELSASVLHSVLCKIEKLEQLWTALEDRVAVLEDNTSAWDCRIEELEEWKEDADDKLDSY